MDRVGHGDGVPVPVSREMGHRDRFLDPAHNSRVRLGRGTCPPDPSSRLLLVRFKSASISGIDCCKLTFAFANVFFDFVSPLKQSALSSHYSLRIHLDDLLHEQIYHLLRPLFTMFSAFGSSCYALSTIVCACAALDCVSFKVLWRSGSLFFQWDMGTGSSSL